MKSAPICVFVKRVLNHDHASAIIVVIILLQTSSVNCCVMFACVYVCLLVKHVLVLAVRVRLCVRCVSLIHILLLIVWCYDDDDDSSESLSISCEISFFSVLRQLATW